MRNAKCASTQTSMEWPYCSFLYCGNIHENLHIEGLHFPSAHKVSGVCCLTSLKCLKCSLNNMVLCYDLSLRSKISTILFGFFLLPFVFYGNTMCLQRVRFCFNIYIYIYIYRVSQKKQSASSIYIYIYIYIYTYIYTHII